jgi:metallo-beta-lactamase family protein
MRIQFCGADRTVTGSCHFIEVNGLRLFLDMGMYQGRRQEARRLNEYLPDDADKADAIILSHGHLDHCGKLPVFVRAGFKAPVYCTPATADVARIVLLDAAEIQEEDAAYLNRRERSADEEPVAPLYTQSDALATLKLFRRVSYGRPTDLGNGVSFTFFDAGHILGSAYVLLEWDESGRKRTLLFTADIGRCDSPIIRDPQPLPGPVDHVITESTYGDRDHPAMDQVEPQLLDAIRWCIAQQGRLIVPAFAVGRTQTMLWYVQKFLDERLIPALPVFVDSPMGVELTQVYSEHRESYDQQTQQMIGEHDLFGLSKVTLASSMQQSKQINAVHGACVIIASSPTLEFGRVLHHAKLSVERAGDMIVFVGWTPPQTLGRRIQEGEKRVRIYDRWYDVRCQVRTIHGLSAHADAEELLSFLKPTLRSQSTAYVVHGEPDQADAFAQKLVAAGIGQAVVPAMQTTITVP